MRKLLLAAGLASVMLVPGTAFGQAYIGAQGNWGDRFDWSVGGRFTVDLTPKMKPVAFVATYDYFWPQDLVLVNREYWEVNVNAMFMQRIYGRGAGHAAGYFGLGLNIADITEKSKTTGEETFTDTRYGLNILGGTKYKVGRVAPFFEFGFTIEGSKQFKITAGLDLALSKDF